VHNFLDLEAVASDDHSSDDGVQDSDRASLYSTFYLYFLNCI
jgi:hypothetical protein